VLRVGDESVARILFPALVGTLAADAMKSLGVFIQPRLFQCIDGPGEGLATQIDDLSPDVFAAVARIAAQASREKRS